MTEDGMAEKTKSLVPGIYEGKSTGFNGPIVVNVTVSSKRIENIEIVSQLETPGIGAPLTKNGLEGETPVDFIPKEILRTQSLSVVPVSGARITSNAIILAVKDALKKAGAEIDEWQNPVEKEQRFISEKYDVIVIGGGGAGLVAAISASQKGASVLVLEKNGAIGGNLLISGGIYNAPDRILQSKVKLTDAKKKQVENELGLKPVSEKHRALQEKVRKEWNAYLESGSDELFDSPAWYALQTFDGGDFLADLTLVEKMCSNAESSYRWLVSLGTEFHDFITQGPGSLWQRTHSSPHILGTGFISSYARALSEERKITLEVNTSVTALETDSDGTVLGVRTKRNDGLERRFHAEKGVVIATGGFAASKKLIQKYNTSEKWSKVDLSKAKSSNRFSGSQGDGIGLGLSVGAGLTQMEQVQLLFLSNTKNGAISMYPPRCVNGLDQIIFVNKEGKRFVREDGRRDDVCLAVLSQSDAVFYCIESGDGKAQDIKSGVTADGFPLELARDLGFIFIAETLDDLASQLSIPSEVLRKTVSDFNESVRNGKDEFGRELFSVELTKGPWIATPRTAGLHHTMGGLVIDSETHVLDGNGKVIPHLFAAGEVTGGIHGGNRLGGNAVVDTVVFGKIAGEKASGN